MLPGNYTLELYLQGIGQLAALLQLALGTCEPVTSLRTKFDTVSDSPFCTIQVDEQFTT